MVHLVPYRMQNRLEWKQKVKTVVSISKHKRSIKHPEPGTTRGGHANISSAHPLSNSIATLPIIPQSHLSLSQSGQHQIEDAGIENTGIENASIENAGLRSPMQSPPSAVASSTATHNSIYDNVEAPTSPGWLLSTTTSSPSSDSISANSSDSD